MDVKSSFGGKSGLPGLLKVQRVDLSVLCSQLPTSVQKKSSNAGLNIGRS